METNFVNLTHLPIYMYRRLNPKNVEEGEILSYPEAISDTENKSGKVLKRITVLEPVEFRRLESLYALQGKLAFVPGGNNPLAREFHHELPTYLMEEFPAIEGTEYLLNPNLMSQTGIITQTFLYKNRSDFSFGLPVRFTKQMNLDAAFHFDGRAMAMPFFTRGAQTYESLL